MQTKTHLVKYDDTKKKGKGGQKRLKKKGGKNLILYLSSALPRAPPLPRSIARNAGVSQESLSQHMKQHGLHLDHAAEMKLAKFLMRFPEVLSRVVADLLLHTLCDYLYELTTTFTEFYDQCYCIEKDKATGRELHRLTRPVLLYREGQGYRYVIHRLTRPVLLHREGQGYRYVVT